MNHNGTQLFLNVNRLNDKYILRLLLPNMSNNEESNMRNGHLLKVDIKAAFNLTPSPDLLLFFYR